jgi:hypothetical protein
MKVKRLLRISSGTRQKTVEEIKISEEVPSMIQLGNEKDWVSCSDQLLLKQDRFLTVNEKRFSCEECGSNVFRLYEICTLKYKCNGCDAVYIGERQKQEDRS